MYHIVMSVCCCSSKPDKEEMQRAARGRAELMGEEEQRGSEQQSGHMIDLLMTSAVCGSGGIAGFASC